MYSRNYTDDERTLRIPEGYDGTALSEPPREEIRTSPPEISAREVKISPRTEAAEEESVKTQAKESGADLSHLPLFLRKVFPCDLGFGFPKLGSEELLIGAVALCVIFSEEKDLVCALLLIALIFVT